jgi:hypothetical protein
MQGSRSRAPSPHTQAATRGWERLVDPFAGGAYAYRLALATRTLPRRRSGGGAVPWPACTRGEARRLAPGLAVPVALYGIPLDGRATFEIVVNLLSVAGLYCLLVTGNNAQASPGMLTNRRQ